MNCNDTQLLLAEPRARLGSISALRITRHLKECADCADYASDARLLEGAASSWRAVRAPDGLRARILAAVESTASSSIASRAISGSWRWIPAPIAAAFAIAAAAFLLHPASQRSGRALAREMFAATAQIQNVHYTVWASDYTDNGVAHHLGALTKIDEEWYQHHCWRKEGVGGSRLIVEADEPRSDGSFGTYYHYDSTAHRVVGMEEMGQQRKDFTLQGSIGYSYNAKPSTGAIVGHEIRDGRSITEFALDDSGNPAHRYLCWVDSQTSLPVQIDQESEENGEWITKARYTLEFNRNLPAALFDPSNLKDDGWSRGGQMSR